MTKKSVDLGEVTLATGKVRLKPTELVIEDPTSGTAAERSTMDLKKAIGAAIVIIVGLVLINVTFGYAYNYDWVDTPPPNIFGRPEVAHRVVVPHTVVESSITTTRPKADSHIVFAQADGGGMAQGGGDWQPVDNTKMPIPDGWTPVNQGPGCPNGMHREATGNRKELPNGNMRVEEICVPN